MSLGAEWDRALLGALGEAWAAENQHRFQRAMRRPGFRLDEAQHRLAAWVRGPREVVVSRALVRDHAWCQVVEVLKHEMAHQYAHEVLGAVDESAHGPAFRDVCARFGVDASASGVPRVAAGSDTPEARILDRVRKLLALAESPNVHEAQSAMNAAQTLLLRYNLDQRLANPTFTFRDLPPTRTRIPAADRWIAALLRDHFFVRTIWVRGFDARLGRTGQWLEVSGTPENVEMADYVNTFLRATADRLWERQRPAPKGGRLAFLGGVVRGFQEKLKVQAEVDAAAGLVWVGDPAMDRFIAERFPALRTIRRGGPRLSEAWHAGKEAGAQLVLHRPIAGAAGNGGRLLGG